MFSDFTNWLMYVYNQYAELTKANPFLATAVAGGFVAAFWGRLRATFNNVTGFIYGRFFITLTMSYTFHHQSNNDLEREYFEKVLEHVSKSARPIFKPVSMRPNPPYISGVSNSEATLLLSGLGTQHYWYKRKWLEVTLKPEGNGMGMVLKTLACNRSIFEDIATALLRPQPVKGKTSYYNVNTPYRESWSMSSKVKRFSDTLISSKLTYVMGKVRSWEARLKNTVHDGISTKISFLLSGPPGTGKSSIIGVLASEFDLPVYNLNIGAIDPKNIEGVVSRIPKGAIVVLEDAPFTKKDLDNRTPDTPTASALLNILEGTSGLTDCIVIITHNNPEDFDKRFLQTGRMGHHVKLEHWCLEELDNFLDRYYPDREYCLTQYLKGIKARGWGGDKYITVHNLLVKSPATLMTHLADNYEDYYGFVVDFGVELDDLKKEPNKQPDDIRTERVRNRDRCRQNWVDRTGFVIPDDQVGQSSVGTVQHGSALRRLIE